MQYVVQLKELRAQPLVSIRAVVSATQLVDFFEEAVREMRDYLAEIGERPAGPPLSLWHSSPEQSETEFDFEPCLPVPHSVPAKGRIRAGELPAGLVASTIHSGDYDSMGAAFDAVWNWIVDHSYKPAGPPRDVVLVGAHDAVDPVHYRTEIAWPVRSKQG